MEAGLEGVTYYDPPNMTYPFGAYAVAVEVDRGTGQWKVKRMVAVDDCGVRINPMIVEGQIMGGLTEGFAMAAMELITFDELGNCIGSNFSDYLLPTSWETPKFELGETVTPSPHHPIGAKGVGVGHRRVPGGVRQRGRGRPGPRRRARAGDAHRSRQGLEGAGRGGPRGVDDNGPAGRWSGGQGAGAGRGWAAGRRGEAVCAGHGGPGGAAGLDPAGDRALVTPDGALAGWVGGACSEPIVVREALRALADGEPRLVRIGPAGAGLDAPDDVVVAESRCASEGVVEVLIEPELPGPLLAVLGEGVAGRTLVQLARIVGWRVTDQLDPDSAADAVVVATMGHGDEDVLAAALKAGVGYVGLVASARRAAVVLDALRERGRGGRPGPGAQPGRPRPRPLDPGGDRRGRPGRAGRLAPRPGRRPRRAGGGPGPAEAVDPVCGMTVAVAGAPTAVRDGVTWYFCSVGCRDHFQTTGGQ